MSSHRSGRKKTKRKKGDLSFGAPGEVHKSPSMFDIRSLRRNKRINRRRLALGRSLVFEDEDEAVAMADKADALQTFGDSTQAAAQPDGGLILPPELRQDKEAAKRARDDSLKALFGTDLAGFPNEVKDFAMQELEKLEAGDDVSPETMRELFRVANAASIVINSRASKDDGEGRPRRDQLRIKKADRDLQVVWGEVYVPGIPDTDGDMMTAEEIRKAAWRFAASSRMQEVDQMHDHGPCDACVVETFVAREEDPTFITGAWVVGVHVVDPTVWAKVADGTYNGFSMEGRAVRTEKQFELDVPERISGITSVDNDHDHAFAVRFDAGGKFLGGETSVNEDYTVTPPAKHLHPIKHGTITELAGANPHRHRYSISEAILEVDVARKPLGPA